MASPCFFSSIASHSQSVCQKLGIGKSMRGVVAMSAFDAMRKNSPAPIEHFASPRIVGQNADWIALLAFNEKAVSRGTGGGLLELSFGDFLISFGTRVIRCLVKILAASQRRLKTTFSMPAPT
jgi:hypothetical protein